MLGYQFENTQAQIPDPWCLLASFKEVSRIRSGRSVPGSMPGLSGLLYP